MSASEGCKTPRVAGVSLVEWMEAGSGVRDKAWPDPFCMFTRNK